jgi:hypothetical protein
MASETIRIGALTAGRVRVRTRRSITDRSGRNRLNALVSVLASVVSRLVATEEKEASAAGAGAGSVPAALE